MPYDAAHFMTIAANGRPRVRVEESAIINAPIATVWSLVRSFAAGDRWLPGVVACDVEAGAVETTIGAIRRLTLAEGRPTRERLIGLSDVSCILKLTIVESTLPMRDYVATFRLTSVSEGDRCRISWTAEFETYAADTVALGDHLRFAVLKTGLDGLRKASAA